MKYSLIEKRKILNNYLTHKNDYATIKEYAEFHGIPPTTMSYLIKKSDEILAGSQDDTQDIGDTGYTITLSHQLHVIAPYTIIDLHLNTGAILYHGRVSAASEVIDKYATYTVGMVMVNHATGGLDIIIYKE
ncbi:MAG: hypothetical protein IJN02_00050 [Bacteroidales bacterium]|nr:hypothetical protein [Bacteroidales bacterium]